MLRIEVTPIPTRTPPLAVPCPTCHAEPHGLCLFGDAKGKAKSPTFGLFHQARRLHAARLSAAQDSRPVPRSAPSRQQLASSFLARLGRQDGPLSHHPRNAERVA